MVIFNKNDICWLKFTISFQIKEAAAGWLDLTSVASILFFSIRKFHIVKTDKIINYEINNR